MELLVLKKIDNVNIVFSMYYLNYMEI